MTSESQIVVPLAALQPARANPFPLTYQQESALIIVPKYEHLISWPIALKLSGVLNVSALCRSLGSLVERHEALRTKISSGEGGLKQLIDQPREFRVRYFELRESSTLAQQKRLNTIVASLFSEPFNVSAGPVLKASLLRLSADEHVLAIVIHHIISDGMSFYLLFGELWDTYKQLSRGKHLVPRPVAVQYPDYAMWQRRSYHDWLNEHGDFWRNRLTGAVRVRIPADEYRGSEEHTQSEQFEMSLGLSVSSLLGALARQERTSLSLVVLSLYVILVAISTGQADFTLACSSAGRHSSEHFDVIGLLSQYLILRFYVTETDTFADMIRKVSNEFHTASEHIDFGRVGRDTPDLLRGGHFNWLPWDPLLLGVPTTSEISEIGLSVERVIIVPEVSPKLDPPADVWLAIWNSPEGIRGMGGYRADLFRSATISNLFGNFRLICDRAVRYPHTPALESARLVCAESPISLGADSTFERRSE